MVETWARHHKTGAVIPKGLLSHARSIKNRFSAIETLYQVLYSAADQMIFGEDVANNLNRSSAGIVQLAINLISDWQKKYTGIPEVTLDADFVAMNMLNHTHFVTYGGEYYSYLSARRTADAIWRKHFHSHPLAKDKGEFLWRTLLAPGSSRRPVDVLSKMI